MKTSHLPYFYSSNTLAKMKFNELQGQASTTQPNTARGGVIYRPGSKVMKLENECFLKESFTEMIHISEMLEHHFQREGEIHVVIQFSYLNVFSAKKMLYLFNKLSQMKRRGHVISVTWVIRLISSFHSHALELGKLFSISTDIVFK